MTRTLLKAAFIASGATLLIAAGPKADLNQDGQVTKAEFTQAAESRFYAADVDNDGLLTKEEHKAHRDADRQNHKDQQFSKVDTNGDGLLSRDEISAAGDKRKAHKNTRRQKFMEKYDTNIDGTLSEAERTVMRAELGDKRGARKGKRKEKRAKRPKIDANEDGLITLDEYMTATEQLFTHLDANADGVLTKGEGHKRKGKRGKKRGG